MSLRRAKTAEEYAEWVKQAKFEVEGLPFMDVTAAHADEIPIHTLLKQTNDTQRRAWRSRNRGIERLN
jgi:hypothetical protein